MAKCADVCMLNQAASVFGESDSQDDVRITAKPRCEAPMKRSPNLKAVYLEGFKRSLAWAILSTTGTEYWQ